MNSEYSIDELIEFSIGGGWGTESPEPEHTLVSVIRGTDIPKVAAGELSSVPKRFESNRKLKNRLLGAGDVILEVAGGSAARGQFTGRTLFVTDEIIEQLGPTICASFCKRLVLRHDLVEPKFFFYFMQDFYKSGRVADYDSQSTGISNFRFAEFLSNETVELPSRPEQTAVSDFLGLLDQRLRLNDQITRNLESIAQALFRSWFVDFDPVQAKMRGENPVGMDDSTAALFPDTMKESELGDIPSGWTVQPFDQIVTILSGGTPKTSEPDYWDGSIPWFSVVDAPSDKDVYFSKTKRRITDLGLANSAARLVRPGITIISARGTVGRTVMTSVPSAFNQSCYGVEGVLGDLFTFLSLRNSVGRLRNLAYGGVFDTITRETFHALRVCVPSQLILGVFEETVTPIFERIKGIKRENKTLSEIRDALLPRLISGELQVPEDLVA